MRAPDLHYIADDLDNFDAWLASVVDRVERYVGRWAEFIRRYGA